MTAPLRIRPVLDPADPCTVCDGIGSVECEDCKGKGGTECGECGECGDCGDCGHQHERECHACDGTGRYACEDCHGWACMVAAREWEHEMVLLIPSEVLRGILRLAPRLDAAGLPHYSVRVEGGGAQPVIHVEVRRDDSEAAALLADTGWQIASLVASENRPAHRLWRYLGPVVRLDVKIATARGVQCSAIGGVK